MSRAMKRVPKTKIKKVPIIQDVIERLIDEHGYSQANCAEVAGVSPSALCHTKNVPGADMYFANGARLLYTLDVLDAEKAAQKKSKKK